jgi:hypothetical protein
MSIFMSQESFLLSMKIWGYYVISDPLRRTDPSIMAVEREFDKINANDGIWDRTLETQACKTVNGQPCPPEWALSGWWKWHLRTGR